MRQFMKYSPFAGKKKIHLSPLAGCVNADNMLPARSVTQNGVSNAALGNGVTSDRQLAPLLSGRTDNHQPPEVLAWVMRFAGDQTSRSWWGAER